jgi:hypothetical protein
VVLIEAVVVLIDAVVVLIEAVVVFLICFWHIQKQHLKVDNDHFVAYSF